MRHPVRRLWQWICVLLIIFFPAGAAAQTGIELYRADEFGIFFFYDTSLWQIVDEETEPGSAYVSFSDGQTLATYWAFDAPGTSAGSCLEFMLDALTDDPTVLAVEDLFPKGSPPDIQDHGPLAVMTIVVTVDIDGQRDKYASDERCEELTPGRSLFYSASSVPAATFNQIQRFPNPWLLGVEFVVLTGETGPVSIPDTSGALDAYLYCAEPTFPVVARNPSVTENFVIDPGAFWVEFDVGGSAPAHLVAWRYPAQLAAASIVLPPDAFGLFDLRIEDFPDGEFPKEFKYGLYYGPAGSSPVFLGHYSGPCYGGGGGSPVLIDLEE